MMRLSRALVVLAVLEGLSSCARAWGADAVPEPQRGTPILHEGPPDGIGGVGAAPPALAQPSVEAAALLADQKLEEGLRSLTPQHQHLFLARLQGLLDRRPGTLTTAQTNQLKMERAALLKKAKESRKHEADDLKRHAATLPPVEKDRLLKDAEALGDSSLGLPPDQEHLLDVAREEFVLKNRIAISGGDKQGLLEMLRRLRDFAGLVDGTDDRVDLPVQLDTTTGPVGALVGNVALAPLAAAVGRMPNEGCTCTHLGQGLVLTAAHCFKLEGYDVTDRPCRSTTVVWAAPGLPQSGCQTILRAQHNELRDYALLRVSNPPPGKVDVALTRTAKATRIFLLGYPGSRGLTLSPGCSLFSGTAGGMLDNADMFAHKCDTEEGNSGSPVFHENQMVGIHVGGEAYGNYASGLPRVWNRATFTNAKGLEDQLRALLGPAPPP
jgi:V8-like Glu-specific endopeptidase